MVVKIRIKCITKARRDSYRHVFYIPSGISKSPVTDSSVITDSRCGEAGPEMGHLNLKSFGCDNVLILQGYGTSREAVTDDSRTVYGETE
jgi:hypothetical protein